MEAPFSYGVDMGICSKCGPKVAIGGNVGSSQIANYGSGTKLSWTEDHRDGEGRLIARQMSFESPELTCIKPKCIFRYLKACFRHAAIQMYHAERAKYAETHRRDTIDEKYRTGEPSPKSFWEAIRETAKLG